MQIGLEMKDLRDLKDLTIPERGREGEREEEREGTGGEGQGERDGQRAHATARHRGCEVPLPPRLWFSSLLSMLHTYVQ